MVRYIEMYRVWGFRASRFGFASYGLACRVKG